MKGDYLGAFEELVLMAVDALGDAAYSAELQRTLERESRRAVSLGAVHSSLERLEAKGLLASTMSDPTGERGGRRRRLFALTRTGKAALRQAHAVRQRISEIKDPSRTS